MRCLVRYITKRSKSGVTHEDASFESDQITIGRATDQKIQLADLRVALQHAQIAASAPGKYLITAQSQSGVFVNDRPVQSARLSVGDRVGIGNNRLEVIESPEGYDLALEVEPTRAGKDAENILAKNSRMKLSETGLRKRTWSWLLLLLVAALFIGLPVSGFFNPDLRGKLREVPVLSDKSWDTGKLANVHQFIGKDCSACHQKPFVKVEDEACASCHSRTPHHVDPELFDMQAIRETRCGSCHHEHNEPSTLVRRDEMLCASCHAKLSEVAAQTELIDADDFANNHPEFRVSLISHVDGADRIERVSLDDTASLVERSGIKFPHRAHLKPEGIKTYKGRVIMSCADCHVPEKGGAQMVAVNMETICADCHRLDFEPGDTERTVPHGDIKGVLQTLQDYYASRALRGGFEDQGAPEIVRKRRRPGASLTVAERKEVLDWAESKWREVAEKMFEFTTCAACHETTKVSDDPLLWEITPVRIANVWMPKATFTHARHRTMECADCHDVAQSELSSDVAMPPIASCHECHGGEKSGDRLVSTCVDCHDFHIATGTVMGQPQMSAEKN